MGIMRLGHVNIKVLDMEESLKHYLEVIGMKITHKDDKGNVYLKCWDEWDKYSLILTQDDTAGMNYISYKVQHDSDIDDLKTKLINYGIKVTDVEKNEVACCGRGIKFNIPSGHEFFLFAQKELVGKDVGTINPDPWPDDLVGAGAQWLDHALLVCEINPEKGINRVEENTKLFEEVFEFYLTEQILAKDEKTQIATWIARTSTPHDIAFVGGDRMGMHHIAFYLEDWNAVLKSADVMSKKRVKMDFECGRHGITRGTTTYFFDPSGNRNETFGGLGYLSQPDMPVITWTEEEIGAAIFYHTRRLRDSFTQVYT
jgi:catechol 2,3-dioxygenase